MKLVIKGMLLKSIGSSFCEELTQNSPIRWPSKMYGLMTWLDKMLHHKFIEKHCLKLLSYCEHSLPNMNVNYTYYSLHHRRIVLHEWIK